jgi:hypothetical protein
MDCGDGIGPQLLISGQLCNLACAVACGICTSRLGSPGGFSSGPKGQVNAPAFVKVKRKPGLRNGLTGPFAHSENYR